MKAILSILLVSTFGIHSGVGEIERANEAPDIETSLTTQGSYEFNIVGRRLMRPIDPQLMRHLARHPEEIPENDYILGSWILRAAVERDESFQDLLENEGLRADINSKAALLAYDYRVNGNEEALDALLDHVRREMNARRSWMLPYLYGLGGVDEWERTKQVLGSVPLSADGAGGCERYAFWLTRRHFFPDHPTFPADYSEFCRELEELQAEAKE